MHSFALYLVTPLAHPPSGLTPPSGLPTPPSGPAQPPLWLDPPLWPDLSLAQPSPTQPQPSSNPAPAQPQPWPRPDPTPIQTRSDPDPDLSLAPIGSIHLFVQKHTPNTGTPLRWPLVSARLLVFSHMSLEPKTCDFPEFDPSPNPHFLPFSVLWLISTNELNSTHLQWVEVSR